MAIAENNQAAPAAHPMLAAAAPGIQGYAEAYVEGQLVRYRRDGGFDGFSYGHPMPEGYHHGDIMEAVIVQIAAGQGQAWGRPFSARFAARMIADRRAYGAARPDLLAEADAVQALMFNRPDLFYP